MFPLIETAIAFAAAMLAASLVVSGGVQMALNLGRYRSRSVEEMLFSDGQVVNANLADYKVPGLLDVPDQITGELVEIPHGHGPFGAKGVGETGMFSPSPAIANAVYDALGVRILEMPFTPERVLRAIREAEGRPLGDE